jgi:hypothetical protein
MIWSDQWSYCVEIGARTAWFEFEQAEPSFDQRPISPRFPFELTLLRFQQPIVPRAAIARWCGPTAAGFQHFFEKQQRIQA